MAWDDFTQEPLAGTDLSSTAGSAAKDLLSNDQPSSDTPASPSFMEAMRNAGSAAKDVSLGLLKGLVQPTPPEQIAAGPLAGFVQSAEQGKALGESVLEAEKVRQTSPDWSKERFEAGFNVVAQMGQIALLLGGVKGGALKGESGIGVDAADSKATQAASQPVAEQPRPVIDENAPPIATLQNLPGDLPLPAGSKAMASYAPGAEPEPVEILASQNGTHTVAGTDGLIWQVGDKELSQITKSNLQEIVDDKPVYSEGVGQQTVDLGRQKSPQENLDDVFGAGPGAAAAGEPLTGVTPSQRISKMIDDYKAAGGDTAIESGGLWKSITSAAKDVFGDVGSDTLSAMTVAKNTSREFGKLLYGIDPKSVDDFKSAVIERQAGRNVSDLASDNILQNKKAFTPEEGSAMNSYANAIRESYLSGHTVEETLKNWADSSKPENTQKYLDAQKLTDSQKAFVHNVGDWFNERGLEAQKKGTLGSMIEEYFGPHIVDMKSMGPKMQQLRNDLVSGKLQKNSQFALHRLNDTEFELESAGYKLKTENLIEKMAAWNRADGYATSDRLFLERLKGLQAKDGSPALAPAGVGQLVKGDDGQAMFIKPEQGGRPNADYTKINHPALRGQKFIKTLDDGTKLILDGNYWVHNQFAGDLKKMLGRSRLYDIPGAEAVTWLNREAKGMKLIGAFHQVTLDTIGAMTGTKFWNMPRIDYEGNAFHKLMLDNGFQTGHLGESQQFSEGVSSGNVLHKALNLASSVIPKAKLGDRLRGYQEYLFGPNGHISQLKMAYSEGAYQRNLQRYGSADQLKGIRGYMTQGIRQIPFLRELRPELADNKIATHTANTTNYLFGLLNWGSMAVDPTFQHALSLGLMAPDFSTARFGTVGQAFTRLGAEQRMVLGIMAATTYTVPRILNAMFNNGDPRLDQPFGVVAGGRVYSIRTIPTDAARAFQDTQQFVYHRLSPGASNLVEMISGRDYRGIRVGWKEEIADALKSFIPIPFTPSRDLDFLAQLENSMGLQVRRAPTDSARVSNMATTFREQLAKINPKIAAEIERAKEETQTESIWRPLNRALSDGNDSLAKREISNLITKQGKSVQQIFQYYHNLPNRPFAGSRVIDQQMVSKMAPQDKQLYMSAIRERQQLGQKVFQVLPQLIHDQPSLMRSNQVQSND